MSLLEINGKNWKAFENSPYRSTRAEEKVILPSSKEEVYIYSAFRPGKVSGEVLAYGLCTKEKLLTNLNFLHWHRILSDDFIVMAELISAPYHNVYCIIDVHTGEKVSQGFAAYAKRGEDVYFRVDCSTEMCSGDWYHFDTKNRGIKYVGKKIPD